MLSIKKFILSPMNNFFLVSTIFDGLLKDKQNSTCLWTIRAKTSTKLFKHYY